MTVRLRFASSPTGRLHVGNARVALVNWLFAKRHGGYFILRTDDIDRHRSRSEHEEAIRQDLRWLGLLWDRKVNQSSRNSQYQAAAERLRADKRLYACYETPEELECKRRRQLSRGAPPVYDRAGLKLTVAERLALEAEGRKPHWRFKLVGREVTWEDNVRGTCRHDVALLSDPVLIRADETMLYILPSVVDDMELGISHVIRGEDHVNSTAAQIQLFTALGGEPPSFAHLPLLTDVTGQVLSKRLGSLAVADLRGEGIEVMALNSLLAKLGTSDPIALRQSLDELVDEFDLKKFGRATAKFDPWELDHLNARLLHDMPFPDARIRLDQLGIDADEEFWLAVRANLGQMNEAREWWRICREVVAPHIEDGDFVRMAAALLPPEPWTEKTWRGWTLALQRASGRKGRELFYPLRLALTGRRDGPGLHMLLPVIGRQRALARLSGEAA